MTDSPTNSGMGHQRHVPKRDSSSVPIPHTSYSNVQHTQYRTHMPNFSFAAQLGARQLPQPGHILQQGPSSSVPPLPQNMMTGSNFDSNYLEDYLRLIESMQGEQARMSHHHPRQQSHAHPVPHAHHASNPHFYSRPSYPPHPDNRLMGISYPHPNHPSSMPTMPGHSVTSNYPPVSTMSTSRPDSTDLKKSDSHFPPIQGIDRSRFSNEVVRKTILNVLSHEQYETHSSPSHSPAPDRTIGAQSFAADSSIPYHSSTVSTSASPLPSIGIHGTLPSIGSIMGSRIMGNENSRSPALETQVRSPALETQVRSPALETQVRSPALETQVRSPALETQVRSPALETQVRSPALETQVISPTLETQIRSPALETQIRSPALETQVRSPALERQIRSPAVESQSRSPIIEQQVQNPSLESIRSQSVDAHVQSPVFDEQVPSPALQPKVCSSDLDTHSSDKEEEYESDEVVSSDGYVSDDDQLNEHDDEGSPPSSRIHEITHQRDTEDVTSDAEEKSSDLEGKMSDTEDQTSEYANSEPYGKNDVSCTEQDNESFNTSDNSVEQIEKQMEDYDSSDTEKLDQSPVQVPELSVNSGKSVHESVSMATKPSGVTPELGDSVDSLGNGYSEKKEETKVKNGKSQNGDSVGSSKHEQKRSKPERGVQKRKKKTPRRVKQASFDSDGDVNREWEEIVAAETVEIHRGETRRPGLRRTIRKTRSVMHLKPLKKRRINMVVNVTNVAKVIKKKSCEKCGRKFKTLESLTKHSILHEKEMLHPCETCGEKFPFIAALTRHRRKHSTEVFKCRVCQTDFVSMNEFKMHMELSHSVVKAFYCKHPGCPFTASKLSNVEKHALIHSEVKLFPCPQCNKSFAQQNGLRSHMRSCFEQRGYLCDICGAKFNHLQSMKSHRRLHTGEKPHKCEDCGASFTDHRNFKRHRRIHENIFPYPCVMCEKKFRHSNSLKGHLKTHGINHFGHGKKCANSSSVSGQAGALSSAELVAGTVLAQLAESLEGQKQAITAFPSVMVASDLVSVAPSSSATALTLPDQKPLVNIPPLSNIVTSVGYSSEMKVEPGLVGDQNPAQVMYLGGMGHHGNVNSGNHGNISLFPADISKQNSSMTQDEVKIAPHLMYHPGSGIVNSDHYPSDGRSHSGTPVPLNYSHFQGHHDPSFQDHSQRQTQHGVDEKFVPTLTTTHASMTTTSSSVHGNYGSAIPSFTSEPQPTSTIKSMPSLPPAVNDPIHAVFCTEQTHGVQHMLFSAEQTQSV